LVQHEKTGFLIEKGDKEGLKEKITLLMEQPELRKQMGYWGRKSYLENFTFEKMLFETLQFYQTVVNKKTKSVKKVNAADGEKGF
jgi:glycosyltransferase involved in cell wall biosynthesis